MPVATTSREDRAGRSMTGSQAGAAQRFDPQITRLVLAVSDDDQIAGSQTARPRARR